MHKETLEAYYNKVIKDITSKGQGWQEFGEGLRCLNVCRFTEFGSLVFEISVLPI